MKSLAIVLSSLALVLHAHAGSKAPTTTSLSWEKAKSMATGRYRHTATLLSNGHVLVAGGTGGTGTEFMTATVYDPVFGTWSRALNLVYQHDLHTATLLQTGKVLLAGGLTYQSTPLEQAGCELYDPDTNTFAATGSLITGRIAHTATLLADGRVLVCGGYVIGPPLEYFASAEIYDPVTGIWSMTGSMNEARAFFTATLLLDGKVLVVGGQSNAGYRPTAELYDPATGSWTFTGSLSEGVGYQTTTLLGDGKVLLAGGLDSHGATDQANVYDPETQTWSSTAPMRSQRVGATATLLPNGQALVTCGYNNSKYIGSTEIFDPRTGKWHRDNALLFGRYEHTATLLPNNDILVVGGFQYGYGGTRETERGTLIHLGVMARP
jgi:N-acetylneuraminic acid mutarotase